MKHGWKEKREGKQKRRELLMGIGLIAYLISLVIRIPLGHIIGDKGIGFFAAGMELFMVLSVLLSYGISKAVAILVKYRVKREMYKGVRKVFRNGLVLAGFAGALSAGLLFFGAEFIAESLLLEHMSYMSIIGVAPGVFLAAVIGVFRGYFQGIGTMMPTLHSKILERFIFFAASLISATILYTYGLKVAGLLKNQEYASAYGALGASLGLTVAGVFGVLHLIFIYMAYSGKFKNQLIKDGSKNVESNGQILFMLLSTCLPYGLCALFYNMNYLVDQRIFNYAVNVQGQENIRLLHWGVYYGKYSVVVGIAAILCVLSVIGTIPRIVQSFDTQEYRDAQYKLGRAIHKLAVISFPCAVIIAVLAEPIADILFQGEIKTAVRLIQTGTALIIFFAFTYFFAGILQRIRKMKTVIAGGIIAFLIHVIFLLGLVNNTDLGIVAVALGNIVFYLIACIIGFLGVMKYMQYTQEWFRTIAVTGIAAGVTGLIGMLLSKALLSLAGSVVTLLVCLLVCVIVYNVLIIVLKGINEDELEEIPGGRIIALLAVRLHLM